MDQQDFKSMVVATVTNVSKALDIPLDQIVVGGGSALVLHGIRTFANDLNIWIPKEHWARLHRAGDNKYGSDNRRDPVIKLLNGEVWARRYNPYHKTQVIDGIRVYGAMELTIHYRDGYSRAERPSVKRERDFDAIKDLEGIHRVNNAVKAEIGDLEPMRIATVEEAKVPAPEIPTPAKAISVVNADAGPLGDQPKRGNDFAWDVVVT